MSTSDIRYPAADTGSSSPPPPPPIVTSNYSTNLPSSPGDTESSRHTRCATGVRFLSTIHGILNLITIVALVCVIISAGVADRQTGMAADNFRPSSSAKVSAFHTRNAVLIFASFGLFFILVDTLLHVTVLIDCLPPVFDKAFIITMLVFAGIYLIIGCCAAAWEKKMRDTVGIGGSYKHKGAAASASFFLFVAMIAIIINFVLRLFTRPSQSYNP